MLEALSTPALVATVAAVLVSLYSTLRGWQAARKSNIPWVSMAPLVLAKHPSAALQGMVRQNGPAILLSIMNYHSVVISSAELAKQVLKQDQIIQKFTALTSESVERTLAHGIVASNGADWRRHRDSSRGFMQPEMISTFIPKFLAIAAKVADQLSALPDGSEVDFGSLSTKATIDVLGLTIIGTRFGALDGECPDALEAYRTFTTELEKPIRFVFPPIEWLHFLQMNKAFDSSSRALAAFIDGIVQKKIQDRKTKQVDKYDMADVMLDSYLDTSSPSHITKEEFYHDLLSFFLAGHETTAGSLSWFLYRAARHQDVQEKIFQEIQEVTKGEFPTEQDLSRLHYLHCVKKEVMRLHPPLGLIPTRICTQDFPLPGTDYILPKGAMIILDPYSIHRDPEHWDDPESFRPERFEDKSVPRHSFAYLPFSAGRRHCVGEPFSLAEQDAILAVILQKFRVRPLDDKDILPKSAIISSPASCRLRFERR